MRLSRLILFAAAALALTGCALFESSADRALRASPNYRAGYSDGCASANHEGAAMGTPDLVRDEGLYRDDKAYHAGWAAGFSLCRSAGTAAPISGSAIPDRNPGGGGLP